MMCQKSRTDISSSEEKESRGERVPLVRTMERTP